MTKFLQPSDQVYASSRYGAPPRPARAAVEAELTPAQRSALESYQAQPEPRRTVLGIPAQGSGFRGVRVSR